MSPRNQLRIRWITIALFVIVTNAEALGALTGIDWLHEVARTVLVSPYTNPFVNYPSLEQIESGEHDLGFFVVEDSVSQPFNIIAHFNSRPYAFETRMAVVSNLRNAPNDDLDSVVVFDRVVCHELGRSLNKLFTGYGVGLVRRSCEQNESMKKQIGH